MSRHSENPCRAKIGVLVPAAALALEGGDPSAGARESVEFDENVLCLTSTSMMSLRRRFWSLSKSGSGGVLARNSAGVRTSHGGSSATGSRVGRTCGWSSDAWSGPSASSRSPAFNGRGEEGDLRRMSPRRGSRRCPMSACARKRRAEDRHSQRLTITRLSGFVAFASDMRPASCPNAAGTPGES